MVVVETKFSLLQKLVQKKLSKEELENTLFDLGMELDELDGDMIKIDVTAERPDLVSPQGIARVLRAYFGIKNPDYTAKKPEKNYQVIVEKSVTDVRPYTVCAIVKNLKFTDEKIKEIIWVQEKIHATFGRNRKKAAIGIYPLEHITLPIYFRADKPENIKFRPLESSKELTAKQILENHPTGKEYGHLLKGLTKYPYFIDSANNILSMPPIINSHNTGRVTEKTKELFIECSGHDFKALSQTLNILVYLFQDLGGEVYSMNIKYPGKNIITPELKTEKRTIKTEFINSMLGEKFDSKNIAKMLEKTMHKITKISKDSVSFEVPPIRTDIWHDVDVADDVLRAYGVNKIKPIVPKVATTGHVLFENRIKKQMTELMIGLGYLEVFTFSLTNKEDQYKKMNLEEAKHIQLGKTVEQSISMVRTWLLPEVAKALINNRNREYPQKVFEINYCVIPDATKDVKSKNVLKMSALMADSKTNFTDIKQVVVYILEIFGIKYEIKAADHKSFIEGRAAKIIVKGKEIGFLGELHPKVLTNLEMEVPLAGFELDLYNLFGIKD